MESILHRPLSFPCWLTEVLIRVGGQRRRPILSKSIELHTQTTRYLNLASVVVSSPNSWSHCVVFIVYLRKWVIESCLTLIYWCMPLLHLLPAILNIQFTGSYSCASFIWIFQEPPPTLCIKIECTFSINKTFFFSTTSSGQMPQGSYLSVLCLIYYYYYYYNCGKYWKSQI